MSDPKKIIRELIDEVLEEMTSSGAVAGYQTPFAFRGKRSKKEVAARSMPGGKVVGKDDETDDTTIGENEELMVKRSLGENRYRNFRESDMMKNHSKVSLGIREAKKILREVDYLVGICERLKTECGIGSDQLWKRTGADLMSIDEDLKQLSKRIYRIGKS